ncbi:MAG TPA: hypothetical protein VGI39_21055 [Polyangiaceae bacterium]
MRSPARPRHTPAEFLESVTVAWPGGEDPGRLVIVSPGADRVAIYDNALAVLLDVRLGRRDAAARILRSLARLQREDGSLPFSFRLEDALDPAPYIRAGALAWVGYAAVVYLDADSEGAARDEVIRMCHALARYLIAHQVQAPGDARQGMVTGGDGTLSYSIVNGQVQEDFEPGAIPWVSTEHNIDTFFFLRALARVAERPDYAAAASRIQRALEDRFWNGSAGQMNRGGEAKAVDTVLALDCASWSALFLVAADDRLRAETALAVADTRYAASDRPRGAAGHRPYASGPLLESDVLAQHYTLPVHDWESSSAVWPEGSAGVALAALRLGRRERAEAILRALEPLRDPSGGLPSLTIDVPFEFDTKPSVAGTVWVELVRDELARPQIPALLWAR